MTDQHSGNDSGPPSKPPIIPLWSGYVAKIKGKLHKSGTKHSEETPQERSSRITAAATVVIAIFAVVAAGAAISQAVISQRQLAAINGQLAVMQADQRPWLSINAVNLAGPLSYDDQGPFKGSPKEGLKRWHQNVTYSISNVGKSPAIDFEQMAELFPVMIPLIDLAQKMRTACNFSIFSEIIGFGREEVVFPGEAPDKRLTSLESLPASFEIAKNDASYAGEFAAVICVTYRAFGSEKTLHTARSYIISKKTGRLSLDGETVPLSQLNFEQSPVENSFAD